MGKFQALQSSNKARSIRLGKIERAKKCTKQSHCGDFRMVSNTEGKISVMRD